MLRLAKCCRPVPGDPIVGYISLGRGITIHREDCPNATALRKNPERFTTVSWEGEQATAFVVEIQIDALGSPPPARGPLARVLGVGHEHRRSALPVQPADGQEPLRRRGRRHAHAEGRRSPGCATSSRCSTPTASRPASSPPDDRRAPQTSPAEPTTWTVTPPAHPGRGPGTRRASSASGDDVQRLRQDRVARLGDLAEVVAVDLQRQRPVRRRCAPSAR